MKRTIRLTETDLARIIRRVISEQNEQSDELVPLFNGCETEMDNMVNLIGRNNIPQSCFANVPDNPETINLAEEKCLEDLNIFDELKEKLNHNQPEQYEEIIDKLDSIYQLSVCHSMAWERSDDNYNW
jgi:flagellin-specific chaperone FliS